MIALDTNVVVRFLVQDDPVQAQAATRLFGSLTEEAPGLLLREVVIETVWVLERAYKVAREDVATALDGLLESREIAIEDADIIAQAIERYRRGGPGFADHLIALQAKGQGAQTLMTFDTRAAKLPEATLLG